MKLQILDASDLRTFYIFGAIGKAFKFVGKGIGKGAKFVGKTALGAAGLTGAAQVPEFPTRPVRSLPIQRFATNPIQADGDTEVSFLRRQLDRLIKGGRDFLEGTIAGGAQGAASAAESGGTTAKSGLVLDSNTLLIGVVALIVLLFALRR